MTAEERNAFAMRPENQLLVRQVVGKLRQLNPAVARMGYDDALSVGQIAMLHAVERFDPAKGTFRSYTYTAIFRKVTEAANADRTIVPPANAYTGQHGANKDAVRRTELTCSLSAIRHYKNEWFTFDDPAAAAFDICEHASNRELASLCKKLRKKHREVLHMRFWLGLTLEEVGKQLGLTRERVRQIQEEALCQLRKTKEIQCCEQ